MPELPEVEVLVNHLRPRVCGQRIRGVEVRRARVVRPVSPKWFADQIEGWRIMELKRRAKYLVFYLQRGNAEKTLLGHLGMSGRMYVTPRNEPLPKHAAVVFSFVNSQLVFEDPRYFGRFLLDQAPLRSLGPEPLGAAFTIKDFTAGLSRSNQPIKQRLLDQCLVAGLGNIYASEALFRARIDPRTASKKLKKEQIAKLRAGIRAVLRTAITGGSTLPIAGARARDRKNSGLYYFGEHSEPGGRSAHYERNLRVYDRAGRPCARCQTKIKKIVQGARSTFFCPTCQPS